MDWSKIKTIFILTFLILDVFLFYQFMKIRDANKYEFITQAPIEEQLKADDIQYVELPKTPINGDYISANPKIFKPEDLAELKSQTASIINNGTTIKSVLKKPVQLESNFEVSDISKFLKDNVLYGDQYQFFAKNKSTITLYEQYENDTFFKNLSGMLTLNINKDDQIYSYEETYLEGIEKLSTKEEILSPLNAIETLHQNGLIKPKSKITSVELGYSTLVQLTASQVLAPTWRIIVNNDQDLFVNAFEGQIIDFNNDENKVSE